MLELHEMKRVLHVVALPMDFNFLCDLGQQLGVPKILLFQIFIEFLAFFPNIWSRLGLYLF